MRIVLGVSGGIAAYKSLELCRLFVKAGHELRVIMTDHAQEFVTPLSFESLSHAPVITGIFDGSAEAVDHIHLGKWADRVVVAPATANLLAKVALGLADDFLSTFCLAYEGSIAFAPAMNVQMYEHPASLAHRKTLAERGHRLLEAEYGFLACGDVGKGRMMEPEDIFSMLFEKDEIGPLAGKHILVTAGPTREAIDPVRFVSNYSSGKMGYAIARQALAQGAQVTLISGPVSLEKPDGVELISIESARDLLAAAEKVFPDCDALVMAAAPQDYLPSTRADQKIKKDGDQLSVHFTINPDILRTLGQMKRDDQVVIGFAAESENIAENAQGKLKRKNLDYILANDITAPNAGFQKDVNTVQVFGRDGSQQALPTMTKDDLAGYICELIERSFDEKGDGDNE